MKQAPCIAWLQTVLPAQRLTGGIALTLEAAWAYDALQSRYSFELSASQGLLQFDPLGLIAERDGRPTDVTPIGIADTDWGSSVRREITDVVCVIRDRRPPLVRADEALLVQRLTDALYQSASEGREVRLRDRLVGSDAGACVDVLLLSLTIPAVQPEHDAIVRRVARRRCALHRSLFPA